jgi:hypothetical protein
MLVKVFGSAVFGVEATTITVEVNIDKRKQLPHCSCFKK